MSLFPQWVDMKQAKEDIPASSLTSKYQGTVMTYRDFADYSQTGTVGYPQLATEEKGNVFVAKVVAFLTQFIADFKAQPLPQRSDPLTKKID
jgi:creatinine amidohydrolase/Fe(II)-dependent formamide hydrolase-like protein